MKMTVRPHPKIPVLLALAAGVALAGLAVAQSSWLALGYYSFLPQADTWQHIDFLVTSASGKLDTGYLFERHNGVHLIALPKLVYYLDIRFMQGSGQLVAAVSLAFLLLTPALVSYIVLQMNALDRLEKAAFIVMAWIILASPMQAESLLNPANLQWSIFTFTITLTGFCLQRYFDTHANRWLGWVALSLALNALTSASWLLTTLPFVFVYAIYRYNVSMVFRITGLLIGLAILLLAALLIIKAPETEPGFYSAYCYRLLGFIPDYLAPFSAKIPFEPLRITLVVASVFSCALVVRNIYGKKLAHTPALLYFFVSLAFIAAGIDVVRSISGSAYNFRFINLPLLFQFSLLMLLYVGISHIAARKIYWIVVSTYMGLFGYINLQDTSETMFFRNHLRLTPVAYALDIKHWALVEELPGFNTGSFDYKNVMAEKEKLATAHIGIYASDMYLRVGQDIETNNSREDITCDYTIESVTRVNDQPAYGIDGSTHRIISRHHTDGKSLDHIWITDMEQRVIGIGLPIIRKRGIGPVFFAEKTWTAYLNPALGAPSGRVEVYAYDDQYICQPYTITLP